MQTLEELILEIKDERSAQRVAAILLYRANKAVKYKQENDFGFAFKFYHLKRIYNDYFIEKNFMKKCNKEYDGFVLCFNIHGIPLIFHQVAPSKKRYKTTVDISNPSPDTLCFVGDVYKIYELLLKILDFLGVDNYGAPKHNYV